MVQLGCTSIANSRIVVRQLEARLEGATEEELNDLARAEIQNVVMQIRDQQDMLARQDQLTQIIYSQEDRLCSILNNNISTYQAEINGKI